MICGDAPGPVDPPPPADDTIPCCMGAALDGHTGCTCWEPIHDVDQADPTGDDTVRARRGRCDDCAYRPDSPEQDNPAALPVSQAFWCHQGMRRIVGWRHPDGRPTRRGSDVMWCHAHEVRHLWPTGQCWYGELVDEPCRWSHANPGQPVGQQAAYPGSSPDQEHT